MPSTVNNYMCTALDLHTRSNLLISTYTVENQDPNYPGFISLYDTAAGYKLR
jgi:hypothetical protein